MAIRTPANGRTEAFFGSRLFWHPVKYVMQCRGGGGNPIRPQAVPASSPAPLHHLPASPQPSSEGITGFSNADEESSIHTR